MLKTFTFIYRNRSKNTKRIDQTTHLAISSTSTWPKLTNPIIIIKRKNLFTVSFSAFELFLKSQELIFQFNLKEKQLIVNIMDFFVAGGETTSEAIG